MLTADGAVNQVLEGYIDRGLDTAEEAGASLVVIRLDTPGGELEAMRRIVDVVASQGRIEKVDDITVSFVFEEPYPLFLTILGGLANATESAAVGAVAAALV